MPLPLYLLAVAVCAMGTSEFMLADRKSVV